MSLIHTALRKVQNKRFKKWDKKELDNPFRDLNRELEMLQTKAIEKYHTERRWITIIEKSVGALLVCALIVGSVYFFKSQFFRDLRAEFFSEKLASPQIDSPALSSEVAPVTRKRTTIHNQDISHILPLAQVFPELVDKIVCTGIMYDVYAPSCIVNNQILFTGDFILSAQILHIDPEVVIFLYQRKLFTLSVV
jgi:hypothetical protein